MDELGALCRENAGQAEPSGSGTLDGLTFALKDVFDVAGQCTGFGQPTWLATHPPAVTTAPAVERLLAAGARMIGRALCDELTYSLNGENVHYGTPLNSACPDRIPGGSSSGSASAVAGGLCDFSLGTDCAGSVRIPAGYCGLYGMRPTHGRVPLEGATPFAASFDTAGWLARDAVVLDRVGRVLLGDDSPASIPGRALIAADAFALADDAAAAALRPAMERVSRLVGCDVEATVTEEGLERWMECFRAIQSFEIWQSLGGWVTENRPALAPSIRERLDAGAAVRADTVEQERAFRVHIASRLDGLIGPGDVLVLPTSPNVAPRLGWAEGERGQVHRRQAISILCIAGLGGLPQVTLPLATLDGCPLGLSLAARRGADTMLLELARQLA